MTTVTFGNVSMIPIQKEKKSVPLIQLRNVPCIFEYRTMQAYKYPGIKKVLKSQNLGHLSTKRRNEKIISPKRLPNLKNISLQSSRFK